jgi:hypothetical protein
MVKSNAAKRNARLDKSFSNNEGGGGGVGLDHMYLDIIPVKDL